MFLHRHQFLLYIFTGPPSQTFHCDWLAYKRHKRQATATYLAFGSVLSLEKQRVAQIPAAADPNDDDKQQSSFHKHTPQVQK